MMPWADTFTGQKPNAVFDAPHARILHLEAARCFHEALRYRRSYLLTVGQRRYVPLMKFSEWSEQYRRKGMEAAATARMLERDLRAVREMQRKAG
jgi:hypothetical protein